MASVEKISELLARPQVISEIAKLIKDGVCEIKLENDNLVLLRTERNLKFKAKVV